MIRIQVFVRQRFDDAFEMTFNTKKKKKNKIDIAIKIKPQMLSITDNISLRGLKTNPDNPFLYSICRDRAQEKDESNWKAIVARNQFTKLSNFEPFYSQNNTTCSIKTN